MRLVLPFLLLCAQAWGASYYVAPDGSDAASGSIGAPWATLGKGMSNVVAGDTLFITTGTNGATNAFWTMVDGTQANPIIIQGQTGNQLRCQLNISNAWYIVRGINWYSNNCIFYDTNCHHVIAESNWVERSGTVTMYSSQAPNTNGPHFCEIRWNVFTNMSYRIAAMGVNGYNNTISSNYWVDSNDNDAIDFFGISNVMRGNWFINVGPSVEHTGNHVDMFQTFGQANHEAHWITIENNVQTNSAGHFFIAQPYDVANGGFNDSTSDIMVRNNLIIGGGGDTFCYAPRVQFINNTWYGNTSSVPSLWIRGGSPYGFPSNCTVLNNIVAESGANAPLAVDADYTNSIHWGYNFASRAGGAAPGAPEGGPNSINGGVVGFVNTNASALDLRLLTNSVCVGTGTNTLSLAPTDARGLLRALPLDMGALAYTTVLGRTMLVREMRVKNSH